MQNICTLKCLPYFKNKYMYICIYACTKIRVVSESITDTKGLKNK